MEHLQEIKQNIKKLVKYDCTGNILLLAELKKTYKSKDQAKSLVKQDEQLRKNLQEIGEKEEVDTVIIITKVKDSNRYILIFEPKGNDGSILPGSFSTVCGNGLRALADYLIPQHKRVVYVESPSGCHRLEKRSSAKLKVTLGRFVSKSSKLHKYIDKKYIHRPLSIKRKIKSLVNYHFLSYIEDMKIGFMVANGDSEPDGEPHLIIKFKPRISLIKIYKFLLQVGPKITHLKKLFPREINVTVISHTINGTYFACTHERGLGRSADHSITASCGSGAACSSSAFFLTKKNKKIDLVMPGGKITSEIDDDSTISIEGPAIEVPLIFKH